MSASCGKVLLIPKGTYDSETQYYVLDWVLYNGRPYVAKQTTTGNLPTNTTYWQLLLDFPTEVDSVPTQDSSHLITSGGVYSGLADKADASTAYSTADSAETIADADYVPFYDTSATAKKKSLWSDIKTALTAVFTGADVSANGTKGDVPAPLIADRGKFLKGNGNWADVGWSDVASKPFSTLNSSAFDATYNGQLDTVTKAAMIMDNDNSGPQTFPYADVLLFRKSDSAYDVNLDYYYTIDGTQYLEQTATLSTSADTAVTFTANAFYLPSDASYDVYTDTFGVNPSNIAYSTSGTSGIVTVTFPKQSSAITITVRLYVKLNKTMMTSYSRAK